MKILIGPVGGYGGVAKHIENILKYSRYTLEPLSSTKNKLFIKYQFAYTYWHFPDLLGFLWFSKINKTKWDIIHIHSSPYLSTLTSKYKQKYNYKFVYTLHALYFREDISPNKWIFKSQENKMMLKSAKNADVVISVARWLKDLLNKNYNINAIHIPNGVNVEICKTVNPERFRKKYGIYEDFFLFGGDARFYKRPNLFLELAKRMPDKLFVMKGKGITKENLLKMGLKIPKNVILLGLIPYQDVIDALAASRVLILPSKNETFGIILLEAMACKKVVVGANNAGPREIITHGKDGFLFEPDNPDDLEKKAIMAWENPELGKNGYEKVKEKYDWKVVIKQIDRVYEKLMGE